MNVHSLDLSHWILSHWILSLWILSHWMLSHWMLSHWMLSHWILSDWMLSHWTLSHRMLSHWMLSHWMLSHWIYRTAHAAVSERESERKSESVPWIRKAAPRKSHAIHSCLLLRVTFLLYFDEKTSKSISPHPDVPPNVRPRDNRKKKVKKARK
jgi:hypothetical protein